MEIAPSIATKVVEFSVAPIGRQLGYIMHYNENIKDLVDQVEILVGTKERVEHKVDEAERNARRIEIDVRNWLRKVEEIIEHAKMFYPNEGESNKNKFSNCVWSVNLIRRHQLSRKAKKMRVEVVSINEQGKLIKEVAYRGPLSRIESSTNINQHGFKSRMSTKDKIVDALADTNVNKVGIYGMGGVGKTMLVKEIIRTVKETKLFDQVILATIGQTWDVKSIQVQIGDFLGLQYEQKSNEGRAALLHDRLRKQKNILIVLDDMWKEVDLESIGIPYRDDTKGCKILITSRDQHLLANEMKTQKNFEVKPLGEEESWDFFKKMIGQESAKISYARDVAKKCGGLPVALATVAKTLKGKPSSIWRDSLKQLRNPNEVNIKGVSKEVRSSLELSYNFIKSEEAKLLFLLCSMFPDDCEIRVEDLLMYAMGMRLLNDVDTWVEARDRIIKLVDDLKSSSLLLESNLRDEFVRMHDVIRDVAIYIASKHDRMSTLSYGHGLSEWHEKDKCGNFRAIFANCNAFHSLPQDLKFPELALLILSNEGKQIQILEGAFFQGMKKLNVLDLHRMRFPQLTTSLVSHSLANLRTLCLRYCQLQDIDKIGEIKTLEILRIIGCSITELPSTMRQLTKLKVLDLSFCRELKIISQNVISRLTKLEELDLRSSFKGWEREGSNTQMKNASLSELKRLSHLTTLNLCVLDANILPKLLFSKNSKLDRFHIVIGKEWKPENTYKAMRSLDLKIESGTLLDDEIHILLKRCDELSLEASVSITDILHKSNGNGFASLRHLSLLNNSDMHHLIGYQLENHFCNSFPYLESLSFDGMESLENIVQMHVQENPFNKLRILTVGRCNKLKNLLSFTIFKGLVDLEEIEIFDCKMIDRIVSTESEEEAIKIECSRLSSLKLSGVGQLTSFCSKQLSHEDVEHSATVIPFFHDQVSFPELKDLDISRANNLKVLWSNKGLIADSFCKLKCISIMGCKSLRNFFPSDMAAALVSLETLRISECDSLEGVFEMEGPIVEDNDDALVLPLKELMLDHLPNLKYVWSKDPHEFLTFRSLQDVSVSKCPQLKSLFPSSFSRHLQQTSSAT